MEGCNNISKEAVDQLVSLNLNIYIENYRDLNNIQAEIERVVELISIQSPVANIRIQFHQGFRQPNSNISITVDSGANHPIIAINRQTLTQGIISTLMSRFVDRLLDDQAGWWNFTDLTNLER